MKTKKYLIVIFSLIFSAMLIGAPLSVQAQGSGGGGIGIFNFGSNSITTITGFQGYKNGDTATETITDPEIETSDPCSDNPSSDACYCQSNGQDIDRCGLGKDMLASCLPKKFTQIPTRAEAGTLTGICSRGNFIFTQTYTKTVGNVIQSFFEGLCANDTSVINCTYKIDTESCLDDILTCADGQKLSRNSDTCTFPSCTENPTCTTDTFACPDGTTLKRGGVSCLFPSCPENPECPKDTFTCSDGKKIGRTGSNCVFSCTEDTKCSDSETMTCEDGTVLKKWKQGNQCVFPTCPEVPTEFSISGNVSSGNITLGGIIIHLYTADDKSFSKPILGTQTGSDGTYILSGIKPGGYVVKPENNSTYTFLSEQSVDIKKTNISHRDFEGDKNMTTGSTTIDKAIDTWLNSMTTQTNTTSNSSYPEGTNGASDIFDTSIESLLKTGPTADNVYNNVSSPAPNIAKENPKIAQENPICGNGLVEKGEICDDGANNGKANTCSADCHYTREAKNTNLTSNSLGATKIVEKQANPIQTTAIAKVVELAAKSSEAIRKFSVLASQIFSDGAARISKTYSGIKDTVTDLIVANTTPKTRSTLHKIAHVTKVAAEYSVVGVTTLLGATVASLNVLAFQARWKSYTVQPGDTMESIGNTFTMTGRAMKKGNKFLRKGQLKPGMKIHVHNRAFIEKDYLDQLKSVLVDALKTRNHGHMADRIEKIFAKK